MAVPSASSRYAGKADWVLSAQFLCSSEMRPGGAALYWVIRRDDLAVRRDPDEGNSLSWSKQFRAAVGLVVAAVRMRGYDAWQQICRPLDWVVATENRLAGVVLLAVIVPTVVLQHVGGWSKVWDDWEQVGVCAGFAWGAVTGWRRLRGITPPVSGKISDHEKEHSGH